MDSELAIIATEWDQIKSFPLHLYELYMKEAIIIDGRNCLPLHEMNRSFYILCFHRKIFQLTYISK